MPCNLLFLFPGGVDEETVAAAKDFLESDEEDGAADGLPASGADVGEPSPSAGKKRSRLQRASDSEDEGDGAEVGGADEVEAGGEEEGTKRRKRQLEDDEEEAGGIAAGAPAAAVPDQTAAVDGGQESVV